MKTQHALFMFVSLFLGSCNTSELQQGQEITLQLPSQPYSYNLGVKDDLPTLGRVLFYDRQLSINNSISCSSCHKQELGFADNVRFSSGFAARLTSRNSMPIQNLNSNISIEPTLFAIQGSLFWDGRERELNSMVLKPLINHVEMGVNDLQSFTKKITGIPYYEDLFTKAYGDGQVTKVRVAEALSWFVRSIRSNQTKFDQHVKSVGGIFPFPKPNNPVPTPVPSNVLSSLEQEGWHLFFEKYNCNSCHQVQQPTGYSMFGGTFANIGLDKEYADNGVQSVSMKPQDAGKFKIPSLRNVTLTAPYMHDGRFATLDDVINHYKEGINDHPNLDQRLRNSDGSPRRISITDNEKRAIIAFLQTLTDPNMISDPKLSNPFKTN